MFSTVLFATSAQAARLATAPVVMMDDTDVDCTIAGLSDETIDVCIRLIAEPEDLQHDCQSGRMGGMSGALARGATFNARFFTILGGRRLYRVFDALGVRRRHLRAGLCLMDQQQKTCKALLSAR